jgi:hypothetical protein
MANRLSRWCFHGGRTFRGVVRTDIERFAASVENFDAPNDDALERISARRF